MEGLKFGWKKSVQLYHYFVLGDYASICLHANYSPHMKNIEFLSDVEITSEMMVCESCQQRRRGMIRDKIIEERKDNEFSILAETHVLRQVTCSEPRCKAKGVSFVSINGPEKEHYCILHNPLIPIHNRKKLSRRKGVTDNGIN